jgi:O-antigen/teichoic acid export membrane protein
MTQSKPLQYYLLGIAALIFSVKIKAKCEWCSMALIGGFVIFFIIASIILYRQKKKIKRLKDKNLL